MAECEIGSIVKGQVTGIKDYGVFVKLENSYTGLIHISEISNDFVGDINKFVQLEEEIYCEVLECDHQNKHLKLSIKNINYKSDSNGIFNESRLGFLPLKQNLPRWINEKLSEIEKDNLE